MLNFSIINFWSIVEVRDHAKNLTNNIKLKKEKFKLNANIQLGQNEHLENNELFLTNNLYTIDKLILDSQALREINLNLQFEIKNLELKNLETRIRLLEERLVISKNNIYNMGKRIYKFVTLQFKTVIDKLISIESDKTIEEIEYLNDLKQYFNSFTHHDAFNIITPDSEEMKEWIKVTFDDKLSVDQEYKIKNSKNKKLITLKRSVLDQIVKFQEEQEEEEEEETTNWNI